MIVVTGATGHVGNNLVRMLLEQGKEVTAMIHNPEHAFALEGLNVRKVYAELLDKESLIDAFRGADKVYHCAALISIVPGMYDKLYATNTTGVKNVIEACKINKVKKLVHVASVEAFGDDKTGNVLNEEAGFRPECAMIEYGATKAYGGFAVQEAVKNGEINATIVAPVGILGPNDHLGSRMGCVFRDFANGTLPGYITGGGFAWVDARDVAKTIIAADEKGKNGEIYLCTSEHYSVADLMEMLEEITGVRKPFIATPLKFMAAIAPFMEKLYMSLGKEPVFTRGSMNILVSNLKVDNSKSREELGIEYMPVRQTVEDAIAWFETSGQIKKSSPLRALKVALAS